MCRIPKVVVVAPRERQLELRRALSSLEYDIIGAESTAEALGIGADVAVILNPGTQAVGELRERGLKIVSVGNSDAGADISLELDDVSQFKTRIWELFRPA